MFVFSKVNFLDKVLDELIRPTLLKINSMIDSSRDFSGL